MLSWVMLTHARASCVVGMQVWCMPVHASASSVSVVQSRCMRAHAGAPGLTVTAATHRGQVCVKKSVCTVMRAWRMRTHASASCVHGMQSWCLCVV